MGFKIMPPMTYTKYEPDENILRHIQQELNNSLNNFIGEINTPETRNRIKRSVENVLLDQAADGVLTPEILNNGVQVTQDNFGNPTCLNINPEVFNMLQRKPKKDSENQELKDKINHLLDVKDSLQNKIKELEDQVEYYKMLSMEN